MDLNLIKEAAKKVEDAQLIYQALSEVGEALAVAGNLEASRLALEPKIATLRAEVVTLERQKAELVAGLVAAQEEIDGARAANEVTIATELAAKRKVVVDEVSRYRGELLSDASDLAAQKETLLLDVKALLVQKADLDAELSTLGAEIDRSEAVLRETGDHIATLKKQMSDIVGKI